MHSNRSYRAFICRWHIILFGNKIFSHQKYKFQKLHNQSLGYITTEKYISISLTHCWLIISRNSSTLHNHSLVIITTAKYLKTTISSNLKWDVHKNNIWKTAIRTLKFLRSRMNISSPFIKVKSYNFIVRPSLSMLAQFWSLTYNKT